MIPFGYALKIIASASSSHICCVLPFTQLEGNSKWEMSTGALCNTFTDVKCKVVSNFASA